MPAHLLIQDGSPWWLSPDLWVVPGNDPNGPPGAPIAGQPAYMWARVSNTGNVAASGTRVDFYWADPSAQIAVGVATKVGSAFVDLAPGDTQEVLCLVPWIPVIVNAGHECILGVAHAPGDSNPIPDPLPNGFLFNPPAHDQIAQRNLTVVMAAMRPAPLAIGVLATGRADKQALLRVEFGEALDERQLALLGLPALRPAGRAVVNVTLSREARCGDAAEPPVHELEVYVRRGTRVPVFVAFSAEGLGDGEYQLVHVVERIAGEIVGGVSYVAVNGLQGLNRKGYDDERDSLAGAHQAVRDRASDQHYAAGRDLR